MIPLAIPSPSSPFIFRVGALQPRWYGLLLACGVLLAGWMTRREFRRRGIDPDLAYSIAVWTVPFGLVGARLYHVITDWGAFWPHHLADTPKIWQGGLGIWGAVLGGMLGTWIGCRRVKLPFWRVADCIAPGLVLAQALGRWGNYANQELYGHPSSLPWAVKIDPAHRYAPYQADSTFQPMFLYESLWDAASCLVLLWFTRRYYRRVPMRHRVRALRRPLQHHPAAARDDEDRPGRPCLRPAAERLGGGDRACRRHRLVRDRVPAPHAPSPTRWLATAHAEPSHVPTTRPEAAIAARRASQRRRRSG